ncbi:MAG: hypothetical protein D6705_17940 [Deltaproteobacteria bacterium]|nr:MAG: hypothetical protein D6705_17940 [Deltaproteobacteria bacterium]
MWTSFVAQAVSAALALGPVQPPSESAPAPPATPSPVPAAETGSAPCPAEGRDESALAAAKQLFETGVSHYEAAEFDQAIHAWYEALSLVPRTSENRKVRAELVYNIARAQERAYDVDHDARRLRRAKRALERFLEEVEAIYPEAEVPTQRAATENRLREIDRKIAEAEAEARRRERERLEAMRPKFDPVLDRRQRRRNVGMLGAGAALTVLGAGALGMMGAGIGLARSASSELPDLTTEADLHRRREVLAQGALGDRLVIAGAVTGGVLLLVGLPLVIAGGLFERERKAYKASYAVAPALDDRGIGLRFGR